MGLALEETLDIIIRKADELREKGVLELEGAGIRIRLAPREPPVPPASVTDDVKEAPVNPLEDPDTFGGEIPRRRGAPMRSEEEE